MTNQPNKSLSCFRTAHLAACAVLVLGTLGVAPVFAQDPSTPPPPQQGEGQRPNPAEMQQRQLDRMTRELSLTPDQVTQIKAIQSDNRAKMEALRGDSTLAPADRRSKMMDMRKDEQAKVRALLTADQQPKYDAMIAREQQRGGRYGGGPGGPGGPGAGAPPTPPPSL